MHTTTSRSGRYVAAETLFRLRKTKYPVKALLDSVTGECDLAPVDRGLAMNLVYGVLRHRQYLDHIIGRLSRQPIKKLHPFVHCALQTGLYQILFLDRIPESAAVNETVNAVKNARLPRRLHGFVNGLLRETIRQKKNLPAPDTDGENPILNHPGWMVDRWTQRFGPAETERICTVNNREPQLILRTNSALISRDDLIAQMNSNNLGAVAGPYSPDSIILPEYQGPIIRLPGYRDGFFQPQDEAAQLAALLLGPFRENGVYLDGCAGLGGKTSHIIQLTHGTKARVTGVEPEPQRQRLFEDNINRLTPERRPTLHKSTLQDYARTCRQLFTGILIDAPCSGTGVTGRHPDIRWNREEADLANYHQVQSELLGCAAQLVAPLGVLVYATCSLEREENQDVVDTFLREYPEFSLSDCTALLPESARRFVVDGCFCPRPHDSIDGFFAARLIRKR